MNVIKFGWALLLLVANVASFADEAYTAEILEWRQNFDADVRNGGWLTGIGKFEIPLGTSTLGSSPTSTMRLPPLHAAKSVGKLIRHGNEIKFSPSPGIRAKIDGHTISRPQILAMRSGVGRIRVGSIELRVRPFADGSYVFVDDLANPAIAEFSGNKWFPIDESYRIAAKFVPYEKPAESRIPLTHIEWKQPMTSTGDVVFTLGGQNVRLKSFLDGDNLFIMFTDMTNGRDTYGGGRFIYAPLPTDGTTIVDFNKAFNPYCSLNQYVYCPIPPAENRLDYRVAAGEQFQGQSRGNAGIREAMKPPPFQRFPRPSHRINALTPILSPCVAWCCLRVERAMGIENTGGAHRPLGIMNLQQQRPLRAIFV